MSIGYDQPKLQVVREEGSRACGTFWISKLYVSNRVIIYLVMIPGLWTSFFRVSLENAIGKGEKENLAYY